MARRTLKRCVQDWLGISALIETQAEAASRSETLYRCVQKNNNLLRSVLPALGRIIAKQDPYYGKDELDPVRKAESDKIADEVIAKLKAEQNVREKYNYVPGDEP